MKFWKKNERGSEMRFLSKYGSHAKRKYNNNCANYGLFLSSSLWRGEKILLWDKTVCYEKVNNQSAIIVFMDYNWETVILFTECVKKSHDVLQTEVSNSKTKTKICVFQEKGRRGSSIWMDGWTDKHLSFWSFMYILLCQVHSFRTNSTSVFSLSIQYVAHQQLAFTLRESKQMSSQSGELWILIHWG